MIVNNENCSLAVELKKNSFVFQSVTSDQPAKWSQTEEHQKKESVVVR